MATVSRSIAATTGSICWSSVPVFSPEAAEASRLCSSRVTA